MKDICINPKIGEMISRYEFNLLTHEERENFEIHLTQCDACFQDLYENTPAMQIINENMNEFHQAVKIQDSKYKQVWQNINSTMVNIFPKPARIAIPVLAMAVVVFFIITFFYPFNSFQINQQLTSASDSLKKNTPYIPEIMESKAAIAKIDSTFRILLLNTDEFENRVINMEFSEDKKNIELTWNKGAEIEIYHVYLIENGKSMTMTSLAGIKDTTFTLPARQLKLNTKYILEVSAKVGNSIKLQQRFEIIK